MLAKQWDKVKNVLHSSEKGSYELTTTGSCHKHNELVK